MIDGIQNILSKISLKEMEKFKILYSMMPQVEQKGIVTLRVFANECSHHIKENRSSSYWRSVKIALRYFVEYFGEQRSISSIQLREIEDFVIHLRHIVKKGYVVYFRNLKAAFNKAIDWKYISENHFLKIKLPKRQKASPAYISSEQFPKILCHVTIAVIRFIILTAYYTGMRLNELVNMTWKNVDLVARIITVGDDEFTTKGRNQRYIPICDELYEVLVRISPSKTEKTSPIVLSINKADNGKRYVFSKSNGMRWTGDYISKKFKNACKAAGIDNSIHFHSLRHSFASNLVQKGVSLYAIKELLGHSSITTTEIYSHLNMDSLREAIKTFDGPRSNSLTLFKSEAFENVVNDNLKAGG
ncbi:MAG: tyrosine-type recombinase/integrase [Ignavibacteriaceae bacterium]|jgi:integrase/recombinase XerD